MDFSSVFSLDFFAVIFAFLFVDLFDTLGTLIGVASKSNMLDEKGRLPHIKGALMADSVATCTGASWEQVRSRPLLKVQPALLKADARGLRR